MTEPLIIWVFMLLLQQHGMAGGAGGDADSCAHARQAAIAEASELGQQIIAASECTQITLQPNKRK